jgi:nitric oxide reductase subunit B
LALMVVLNLFPGGVMQLIDVLQNGYWHARSPEFLTQTQIQIIEWIRLPADIVFIVVGVMPLLIASFITYGLVRNKAANR